MNSIEKPKALITGASRGIGAAIAKTLARDGYHILINYKANDDKAKEVMTEIEKNGGSAELLKFDISDFAQCQKALEPYTVRENALDVLVNNAGIRKDTLMLWMTEADWKEVIDTNLGGTFNVTRWALAGMFSARKGCIVNITSTSGQSGMPGQYNYSSAKAGQIGATKSLALEVGKRNVRVNAVAPGFIETDLVEGLPVEEIKKRIPLQRFGSVEDVAGVVSFLCSSKAAYITGEVISVNGGIHT